MGKKITILIILFVIFVALIYFFGFRKPTLPQEGPMEEEKSEQEETTMPEATGNIFDMINAINQGIEDEDSVIGNAAEDKNAVLSDAQEVSAFNQSANENEF